MSWFLVGVVISVLGVIIWFLCVARTLRYTWFILRRWGIGAASNWFQGKCWLLAAGLISVGSDVVIRGLTESGWDTPEWLRWGSTFAVILCFCCSEWLVGTGFQFISDREAEHYDRVESDLQDNPQDKWDRGEQGLQSGP